MLFPWEFLMKPENMYQARNWATKNNPHLPIDLTILRKYQICRGYALRNNRAISDVSRRLPDGQ
jgi:hypothetical protein